MLAQKVSEAIAGHIQMVAEGHSALLAQPLAAQTLATRWEALLVAAYRDYKRACHTLDAAMSIHLQQCGESPITGRLMDLGVEEATLVMAEIDAAITKTTRIYLHSLANHTRPEEWKRMRERLEYRAAEMVDLLRYSIARKISAPPCQTDRKRCRDAHDEFVQLTKDGMQPKQALHAAVSRLFVRESELPNPDTAQPVGNHGGGNFMNLRVPPATKEGTNG